MSTTYSGVKGGGITSSATLTSTHVATITTPSAHGLVVGDVVHIIGAADPQIDGENVVAGVTSGTVFTIHNTYFTTATGSAGGSITVDRNLTVTIPSDGDGPGIKAADVNTPLEAIIDYVADVRQQHQYELRGIYSTGKSDTYSSTNSWAGLSPMVANTWEPLAQTLTNADGDPNHLLTSGGSPLSFDPLAQAGDIFVVNFTCAVNLSAESAAMALAVSLNGSLASTPLQGSDRRIIPVNELNTGGPTPVCITGTYTAVAQGLVGFGLLVNGIFSTSPNIICPNSWQITVFHYRPVS